MGYVTKTNERLSLPPGSVKRQPMVIEHMERADMLSNDLHNAIERLEERLTPAIQPQPNYAVKDDSDFSLTPALVQSVAAIADRLAQAVERLNSITERLEI